VDLGVDVISHVAKQICTGDDVTTLAGDTTTELLVQMGESSKLYVPCQPSHLPSVGTWLMSRPSFTRSAYVDLGVDVISDISKQICTGADVTTLASDTTTELVAQMGEPSKLYSPCQPSHLPSVGTWLMSRPSFAQSSSADVDTEVVNEVAKQMRTVDDVTTLAGDATTELPAEMGEASNLYSPCQPSHLPSVGTWLMSRLSSARSADLDANTDVVSDLVNQKSTDGDAASGSGDATADLIAQMGELSVRLGNQLDSLASSKIPAALDNASRQTNIATGTVLSNTAPELFQPNASSTTDTSIGKSISVLPFKAYHAVHMAKCKPAYWTALHTQFPRAASSPDVASSSTAEPSVSRMPDSGSVLPNRTEDAFKVVDQDNRMSTSCQPSHLPSVGTWLMSRPSFASSALDPIAAKQDA
jgi:hypothetical protein